MKKKIFDAEYEFPISLERLREYTRRLKEFAVKADDIILREQINLGNDEQTDK